jgi:hypothetical protein
LQCGASESTAQLQLPPRRVSPTKPPASSARAPAPGAPKQEGWGPAKSSGIAIEAGLPKSTSSRRPWASNCMTLIVSLAAEIVQL